MIDSQNEDNPSFQNSLRGWIFIVAISPMLILLGFHIAGLAILARKHLRVPYIVSVSILMVLMSAPLIFLRGNNPLWIPLVAVLFVQVLVIVTHLMGYTKEELLDGGNLEHIAPAHMMLCVMFLLLPAVYAAQEAYRRLHSMHVEPPRASIATETLIVELVLPAPAFLRSTSPNSLL